MALIDQWVLAASLLLLLAIVASALSYRTGMPLLLVFLAVGMLAGEDGPGGIVFNDAGMAYAVGSVALAVILLDGGLNTRAESFRVGLRPAAVLATLGVFLTCVVTGLFAAWALDFGWLEGLLIGAIAGSTDAAAVFALLRAKGMNLKQRVSATLEIESGSNDPMAVLLTVVFLELILSGQRELGWNVVELFALQLGLGLIAGLIGGRLLAALVQRLPLEPGMYPMLVLAGGLTLYALTTTLGGSGFLAIYLAGVVMGNWRLRAFQPILQVHNGMAWFAQLGMFLMLGLLATPSALFAHAPQALAIALVLMFVARPMAVAICLWPFRFPWREQIFIAWVGLRGAVPIILALFPLLAGLPQAPVMLNVAFFVVLVSLTLQGWSIPYLARHLRLEVPPAPEAAERCELGAGEGNLAVLGYRLEDGAKVLGRAAVDLPWPAQARPVTVLRAGQALAPADAGRLQAGDRLYVLARQEDAAALGEWLAKPAGPDYLDQRRFYGDFTVRGQVRLADLAAQYDLPLPQGKEDKSLNAYLSEALGRVPVVGDRHRLGNLEFVVREVGPDGIRKVGLRIPTHLY